MADKEKLQEERKTGGPKMLRPGLGPQARGKQGGRENKKLNNKIKKIKSEFAALKETAKDKLNPMKADRVFDKYRSPRNAKIFFANEPGSKYEGMADKAMERKIEVTKKNQNLVKMAKGGRAGFKSGSKGCKLAMKGKGRAYGKNS